MTEYVCNYFTALPCVIQTHTIGLKFVFGGKLRVPCKTEFCGSNHCNPVTVYICSLPNQLTAEYVTNIVQLFLFKFCFWCTINS